VVRRWALVALACTASACGHIQSDKTDVRVFNALYDYETLDLVVGDRQKIEGLPYGVISAYVGVSVVGNDDGAGNKDTSTTVSSTPPSSSSTSTSTSTLPGIVEGVTAALVTTSTVESSTTTTSTTTTTLASGTRTMRVFVDEAATRLIEQSVGLTADQKYTLYAYQGIGAGRLARLVVDKESKQKTIAGKLKIRVADMAPSTGVVDVYVLQPGQTVSDVPPAATRLTPSGLTEYLDVAPGRYRIVLTQVATKTSVFNSGPIDFVEGTVQTMVIFEQKGGGGPQYVLTSR
jgi:hypothetical protein